MWMTIELPGLKPSLRSYGPGLTRTPFVLAGTAELGRFTRRPVTLLLSCVVSRSSGNGSRHARAA